MSDNKLEQLKNEYMNTPIPKELDYVVEKAIKDGGINNMKRKNKSKKIIIVAGSIAASIVILTTGINTSPVLAQTLSKVPVVSEIVKVLTFREYTSNEDTFNANIKVPQIQGLGNKDLENSLNRRYLEENKKLYDEFMEDVKDLKANGGGHLGVDSGYIIKTDTDEILSIGRYVVNTVASSSTKFKYDTIDKENEILITLPSLFRDNSYIEIISGNIKEQMIENHKLDENKIYWAEGIKGQEDMVIFEEILDTQNFFISEEGKLVISFDKYEVSPGYMGVLEFIIPTELMSDILIGNEYIK